MAAKKTVEEVKEETPQEVEALNNDVEGIIIDPGAPVTLLDGTVINIRPIKMREMFALLKIVTRGAAISMGALPLSMIQDSDDQFLQTITALLINAIPEADQEVCEFLRIVTEPVAPDGKWNSDEELRAAEDHLSDLFLINPEIEDVMDILTIVAYRESRDMQRLVKKVESAIKLFQATSK